MIKSKSILAIGMVALFIGLSFSPVTADEIKEENETETYDVEIAVVDEGIIKTETIKLTEREVGQLQLALAEVMEKLETADNADDVMDIIGTFPFFNGKHPILTWILNFFSVYKLPRSRAFVFSHGWGYKINPFKGNTVDLYRPFTMWQYSTRSRFTIPIPAKTFIMRFSPFNVNFLHGTQIGMMSRFIGLYIYISQPVPQKSYTFFMGTARHIGGLDFKLSPLLG